jgi:hypothetical protein
MSKEIGYSMRLLRRDSIPEYLRTESMSVV